MYIQTMILIGYTYKNKKNNVLKLKNTVLKD